MLPLQSKKTTWILKAIAIGIILILVWQIIASFSLRGEKYKERKFPPYASISDTDTNEVNLNENSKDFNQVSNIRKVSIILFSHLVQNKSTCVFTRIKMLQSLGLSMAEN